MKTGTSKEPSNPLTPFLPAFTALLILTGCATQPLVQTDTHLSCVVTRIKGQARFRVEKGNGAWQSLKVGDAIHPGMVIQTQRDSGCYVDLALGQYWLKPRTGSDKGALSVPEHYPRDVLRLYENSVLGIEKLTRKQPTRYGPVVEEVQVDLRTGQLLGGALRSSWTTLHEIKFPRGTARIHEGVYSLREDGVLHTIQGTASIATDDGNTNEVPAGYIFRPGLGSEPYVPPRYYKIVDLEKPGSTPHWRTSTR